MIRQTIEESCFLHARIGWQGLTKAEYLDEGDYYLVTGVDFDEDSIDFEHCHYVTKERYDQDEHIQLKSKDVLVTKDGTIGKVAIISELDKPATLNSGVFVVRPKDESKLLSEYLVYALKSTHFKEFIDQIKVGCTIAHLNQAKFLKYEIPNISVSEQQFVVKVLKKVEVLIKIRRKELRNLDILIKARFVELFGDQELNPNLFEIGKLSDVADIYLGLTHTPTYVEQGRPFLSVRDISSGVIDFSNCHYITEEEFNSLPKGARPQAGDMLFCRVGTIGKPVIIPENTPEFGTFVSVGYLRRKTSVNNSYLKAWMENEYFMRQVYDNVAGASQINLNTGWLKNFRILVPPIELQNQFAAFVEQIDKSKVVIQQSLDKLELLKKSLMQEYFG